MTRKQKKSFLLWIESIIEYVDAGFDIDCRRSEVNRDDFIFRARGLDGGEAIVKIEPNGRTFSTTTGERVL